MTADILERLQQGLGPMATEASVAHGVAVFVLPPAALTGVVARLKSEFGFDLFLDVTAVDWPRQSPRFEVVWHFYSTEHKVRVRLKARVDEADPTVDSLVPLYNSARFMERECHDMYGIRFRGNDDLRPILLYEGFVGHPLRKDYAKDHEQPLVPYIK
ncbi:MAG: NADH-quinone oxidoreductase subunit C [Betaproteobacteria bacterium]